MWQWFPERVRTLSLAQQFMLASLLILIMGMVGIGWWVGRQIEAGVVHRTAATTALYVDSFVAPNVQELAQSDTLTPEHRANLNWLLRDTSLGQEIGAFKLWDADGRILYSDDPALIGRVFPVQGGLARAWRGEVAARISDLDELENQRERVEQAQLLELYSPVRLTGTNQIIAVAEFYHTVDDLQRSMDAAQLRSWLIVGSATLAMYLLLAGFVQRMSDTIARQQVALNEQIARLAELLAQNEQLHERVRRAAVRTTALNERFLRRISAELHDGPVQDLGLALLRLDRVAADLDRPGLTGPQDEQQRSQLDQVQESMRHALQEIRAIASGLGLPQLHDLSLLETLARAVRAHERRTSTSVTLLHQGLPEQASLSVKITLYRMVQEALTNAYRHAGGQGQQVRVSADAGELSIQVTDCGPGFDATQIADWNQHLGLAGMRERVESLGGQFWIESAQGQGTTVIGRLSLQPMEGSYE